MLYYLITYDNDGVKEVHRGFSKFSSMENKRITSASQLAVGNRVQAKWIDNRTYTAVISDISNKPIRLSKKEMTPKTSQEHVQQHKVRRVFLSFFFFLSFFSFFFFFFP